MRESSKLAKQFGRDVQAQNKLLGGFSKGMIAAAGAITATVVVATKATRELRETSIAMDELIDSSNRIGISTDKLGAFRHGATLSGVSVESLDGALLKMTRNLVKGADGSNEMDAALRRIGINAKDIVKLRADQQFLKIADAISHLKTEGEQGRAAVDIFGRSGAELIPLLKEGSDGLRKMEADARKLGITFDADAAKKVAAFNDEMDRLKAVTGGIKQDIVIAVAPAAEKFIRDFRDTIQGLKGQARAGEGAGRVGTAGASVGGFLKRNSLFNAIGESIAQRMIRSQVARENAENRKNFAQFPLGSLRSGGRMPVDPRKNPQWLQDFTEEQENIAKGTRAGLRAIGNATGISRFAGLFSSDSFRSGVKAFADGFESADNFLRRWAEKDFMRRLQGIGAETDKFFRERKMGRATIMDLWFDEWLDEKEAKEQGNVHPFTRESNVALEKGTREAFIAAQSHKRPELKEMREQTDLLREIAANTENFAAAEVGLS